ncbi:MAG: hypothetical protein ABI559_03460 [Chloroflexota bacterium]
MHHPLAALPQPLQRPLSVPPLLSNVAFSSRRRYKQPRRAQQFEGSLPDWVWGAGLGVIVLLFVGGFLLFSQCTGSSSTCDTALKPLGNASDTTARGFADQDVKMGQLVTFLQQGDINGANVLFYQEGTVHNFMHNVDPLIRAKDSDLAKNLCNAVVKLETDMEPAAAQTPQTMANDAIDVRNFLRQGAQKLDLGTPAPTTPAATAGSSPTPTAAGASPTPGHT